MKEEQAIDVLIQIANLAQSKGLLTLNDAVIVAQCIEVLKPKKTDETE